MDEEITKHLLALKEVNRALITGLETAIYTMQKWDEMAPERRESIIEKLLGLIAQSNQAYEMQIPKH